MYSYRRFRLWVERIQRATDDLPIPTLAQYTKWKQETLEFIVGTHRRRHTRQI